MPFDRLAVTALLTICLILGTGKRDVFPDGGQERDEAPMAESLRGTDMISASLLIIMPISLQSLPMAKWRSATSEIPNIWNISSGLLP